MKRILSMALSVVIFATTLSFSTYSNPEIVSADTSWPGAPAIYGEAAVLIEASTGTILYGKKCEQKMYPASITKIMTALLTIENCELDETVEFSDYAVNSLVYGDANIACSVGEKMSVKECLYALMLHSANEVATALGEHISGSIDEFSKLMTERAKQAGTTGTNFKNANGLHDDKHYITAHDMALITRDALEYPLFREIVNSTSYSIKKNNKRKEALTVYQRHKMVLPSNAYYYDGIIGGKTGFTDQSGTTLVTCAEQNGMTLICVVLNSNGTNVYKDTTTLFNYGFENFHMVNVSEKDTRFSKTNSFTSDFESVFNTNSDKLYISEDDEVVLPKDATFSDVTSEVAFLDKDSQKDGTVATISYKYGDTLIGTSSILYGTEEKSVTASKTVTENATKAAEGSSKKESEKPKENVTKNSSNSSETNEEFTKSSEMTDKIKNENTNSSFTKVLIILFIICIILAIIILLAMYQRRLNRIRAAKRRRKY